MMGIVILVAVGMGGYLLIQSSRPKVQSPKVETQNQPTPTSLEEPVATGPAVEVTVEGGNYKFSPAMITAKKGDTIKLTFRNGGGMHDFVIDEFDVKTNQIGEGEEEDVEFVADKTGTFEFYCSVGNHRKMGMVGKLVVE